MPPERGIGSTTICERQMALPRVTWTPQCVRHGSHFDAGSGCLTTFRAESRMLPEFVMPFHELITYRAITII